MWKLTTAQKLEICTRYEGGESGPALAGEFGISCPALYGILHRRGKTSREQSKAQRKCTLNEQAFDVITEASAYWAGFLMADGTVVNREHSPEIALVVAKVDTPHLENFKNFLGSSHRIITVSPNKDGYNTEPYARFAFRSRPIADALARFGIVPNKTNRTSVFLLENNLHFWRGVIDGDGWIGLSQKGKPHFSLTGSKSLLEQFVSFANLVSPHASLSVRPHKSVYRVGSSGNTAKEVITALYDGCSTALARKLAIAQSFA